MSKRIILFAGVLFLALILIIGFVVLQKKSTSLSNPIKAIPVDASLIIQINDFHNLNEQTFVRNKVFSSLSAIAPFDKLLQDIAYIDSLAANNAELANLLFDNTLFVSGHFIGGRKTDFLFIIQQVLNDNLRQGIDYLSKLSGQNVRDTERKYEGKSIYTVKTLKEGEQSNLYLAEVDGNLLISRSVILIENAIRQYSLPRSLASDESFNKVTGTAGKSKDANIYIDMSRFTSILSVLANDKFNSRFKEYHHFGGWTELDLNATENQIMLNGFIAGLNGESAFTGLFSNNDPVNITVDKILPASVSSFVSFGVSDIEELNKNFGLYLASLGNGDKRKNQLAEFERKYGLRIETELLDLIDEEITLANGIFNSKKQKEVSGFVLLRCKSGTQASKKMHAIIEKIQSAKGGTVNSLQHNYTVDADTRYAIYEVPYTDLTGLLFGNLFTIPKSTFYTIFGNYIVFSNSREALGEFIYSNVLSKTLSTDEAYKAFNSNIAQKSYMVFYTNLARSSSVFRKYLHEDIIGDWETHFDVVQKIQPLGFQITEVSGMNYANILVQYLDDVKGKPQTVWESLLDTTFTFKPQLVENHYTKQNEIFLQDDANTIYLINKAGRILWKQKITEPINSEVYQIDYYKNGKLQLLFSTENYLHLIDRNGNYVERYPVRLRERATAGLSLFDYEDNRNYRLFIPCADNNIYAYTKDGSLISGWQYEGSESAVTSAIKHFRVEDKDFIVLADQHRAYVLDRRGSIRVPVERIIEKSVNNNFHLESSGNLESARLVTTDNKGNVLHISFNGKVETISLGTFSSQHFFDYKDVNADGQKDYIFLDENRLSVFGQDKSEILNFSFPNDISKEPIYFNFSYSDRKLGIVDDTDRRIYLINQDGTVYKGFPLEGSTLFSIGYLESRRGEFNLIVGGRNNFLYNYSVQ